MSELTYKKIIDVETVEALNDGATVFVNDNGAMKQVGADKFGAVKTVNGVAPDENGDVVVKTPRECLFVDASAMVPGLVQSFWSVGAIISTYREAKGTITFGLEVVDATTQKNGPTISHTASDMETITDDAGNTGYKIIIWFGDDHAPIIVNGLTNTITLDPDWVKPEESIQPDWNQNDPNAPDYVKNRTHWEEIKQESVVEETTITGANGQFTVVNAVKADGKYIVTYNGTEYSCTPKTDPSGDLALGNLSLAKSTLENTGEPFLLTGMSSAGAITYALFEDKTGTHVFAAFEVIETVHKLDPKYLPTGLAQTEDVNLARAKAELAAICPEALADPNVEIYYDPAKTEIMAQEHWNDTEIGPVLYCPNVTSIGDYAFQNATNVTAAIFPNALTMGKCAFRGTKLTHVSFPSLVQISYQAFVKTSLVYADFPAVETINNGFGCSFANCASLVGISMPKLKTVDDDAMGTFSDCTALTEVNLPILENTASDMFAGCSSLKRIDLPMVTLIGMNAFRNSGIEALILRGDTVCELYGDGTKIFTNTPITSGTGYIYVPAALIEDYKVATNWSTYAAQFRAIEDYPDICDPTIDEQITKRETIELINEKVAGINKAIPFVKQGDSTYKCSLTFAEAADLIKNGQNQVNATLSLTNMDESTMTLISGCCYASANEVGIKLGSSEVTYIRASFKTQDGSVVKLQYDPDNTITVLNDAETEGSLTEDDVNTLIGSKLSELAAQELSLPKSAGVVDHGTAGQFAVSDGMGGIMWKTLVEAEEVAY
jgi:hypothetical protein